MFFVPARIINRNTTLHAAALLFRCLCVFLALILLAAWLVPGRLKLHVIIPGYRPKLDDDMVCSGELKKCTAHLILYCTVHFTAQGGRSIEGRFLVSSPPKTAHMYVRSKITFACLRVGTKMLACLSSLVPRSRGS